MVVFQMSWAASEWKDGLPGLALQKITEIEAQRDKYVKETQQKQFRIANLEEVKICFWQ